MCLSTSVFCTVISWEAERKSTPVPYLSGYPAGPPRIMKVPSLSAVVVWTLEGALRCSEVSSSAPWLACPKFGLKRSGSVGSPLLSQMESLGEEKLVIKTNPQYPSYPTGLGWFWALISRRSLTLIKRHLPPKKNTPCFSMGSVGLNLCLPSFLFPVKELCWLSLNILGGMKRERERCISKMHSPEKLALSLVRWEWMGCLVCNFVQNWGDCWGLPHFPSSRLCFATRLKLVRFMASYFSILGLKLGNRP